MKADPTLGFQHSANALGFHIILGDGTEIRAREFARLSHYGIERCQPVQSRVGIGIRAGIARRRSRRTGRFRLHYPVLPRPQRIQRAVAIDGHQRFPGRIKGDHADCERVVFHRAPPFEGVAVKLRLVGDVRRGRDQRITVVDFPLGVQGLRILAGGRMPSVQIEGYGPLVRGAHPLRGQGDVAGHTASR